MPTRKISCSPFIYKSRFQTNKSALSSRAPFSNPINRPRFFSKKYSEDNCCVFNSFDNAFSLTPLDKIFIFSFLDLNLCRK
ncbi:Hypothetical protein A7A1_2461 [Bacillus subtilis subsp. subtilis str. BSP1]|nr:Hypothetical protein A7A1_2461 [Bacillus subtilis subsp. subtilis str. BSP1]